MAMGMVCHFAIFDSSYFGGNDRILCSTLYAGARGMGG